MLMQIIEKQYPKAPLTYILKLVLFLYISGPCSLQETYNIEDGSCTAGLDVTDQPTILENVNTHFV